MLSSDFKILVPIDDDETTTVAVSWAVRKAKLLKEQGTSVAIALVNLYSSWDITGHQQNTGKLSMDLAESFVEQSGVRFVFFEYFHLIYPCVLLIC